MWKHVILKCENRPDYTTFAKQLYIDTGCWLLPFTILWTNRIYVKWLMCYHCVVQFLTACVSVCSWYLLLDSTEPFLHLGKCRHLLHHSCSSLCWLHDLDDGHVDGGHVPVCGIYACLLVRSVVSCGDSDGTRSLRTLVATGYEQYIIWSSKTACQHGAL